MSERADPYMGIAILGMNEFDLLKAEDDAVPMSMAPPAGFILNEFLKQERAFDPYSIIHMEEFRDIRPGFSPLDGFKRYFPELLGHLQAFNSTVIRPYYVTRTTEGHKRASYDTWYMRNPNYIVLDRSSAQDQELPKTT